MHVLRIEHPVPGFAAWKAAFDSDPLGRRKSGVLRHRVQRLADDERFVAIDLEFRTREEAEAMLLALRALWTRVDGTVVTSPQARVFETVEATTY